MPPTDSMVARKLGKSLRKMALITITRLELSLAGFAIFEQSHQPQVLFVSSGPFVARRGWPHDQRDGVISRKRRRSFYPLQLQALISRTQLEPSAINLIEPAGGWLNPATPFLAMFRVVMLLLRR